MEALYQPSSGVFPQIQWDFLVLLSGVCLNFQDPGLLENVEPRVQQSSAIVSDNIFTHTLCCVSVPHDLIQSNKHQDHHLPLL